MRSICAVLVGLSAACTQFTTYGYQYKMQQSFGGEEPEAAPREARQLLANARTVAFYPPDVCINVDAGGVRAQQLHSACGVLMSSLERAAEGAGYEVVSWQNLRGNKRAIDFARESNVDVLFEVNEFDLGAILSSQIEQRLSFFEQADTGTETPLSVSTGVAQTCAGYAKSINPSLPVGQHGTIDIKTVSVVDGRMRWRYRKVLTKPYATATQQPQLFRSVNKPKPLELALGIVGGLAVIGGATLITIEQVSPDDPLTPQNDHFDTGGKSYILTIAGLAAVAGAIVYHYQAGTDKPDPAAIMCDGRFAVAIAVPMAAPPATTYSAEHTFSSTQNAGDNAEAEQRQLSDTMIAQFIDELKAVHPVGGPRPPAPPSPPAPAAPGGAP
jgi:hypothetical protein